VSNSKSKRDLVVFGAFLIAASCLVAVMIVAGQKKKHEPISREEHTVALTNICKQSYQASIRLTEKGDTLWVYLPYTGRRVGMAQTKDFGKERLEISFYVSSLNPFMPKPPEELLTFAPSELTHVVQGILGDLNRLSSRLKDPYEFYVLVVVNITSQASVIEDWFMMYAPDFKKYPVGLEYSGEALSRLVVAHNQVESAYHDVNGAHVNYHEVTMKEFVDKQIEWRIYQRFTEGYSVTPFNMTRKEKFEEVQDILKKTVAAYDFRDYDEFMINDISYTEDDTEGNTRGISAPDLRKFERRLKQRLPAF
jgi:uncharacterized protein YktA (UPF0223 family)